MACDAGTSAVDTAPFSRCDVELVGVELVGVELEVKVAVRRCRGCMVLLQPPKAEASKWERGAFWPLCGACARVADEADGVSDETESGGMGGLW